MRYYVTNIDWDTNTSEGHERSLFLPEDVVVLADSLKLTPQQFEDDEAVGAALEEYISCLYGFHLNSFSYVDESEVTGGERS